MTLLGIAPPVWMAAPQRCCFLCVASLHCMHAPPPPRAGLQGCMLELPHSMRSVLAAHEKALSLSLQSQQARDDEPPRVPGRGGKSANALDKAGFQWYLHGLCGEVRVPVAAFANLVFAQARDWHARMHAQLCCTPRGAILL